MGDLLTLILAGVLAFISGLAFFWILALILLGVLVVAFGIGIGIWQNLYYRISESYCHILMKRAYDEEWTKHNYDKALEYYYKSLRFSHTMSDDASIYSNIGRMYFLKEDIIEYAYENKSNTKQAIEYLKKAMEIYQRIGNYGETAQKMTSIASSYTKLKNFSEAEHYLAQGLEMAKKYLDMAKKSDDKEGEVNAYKMLGQIYSEQNQEALSKEYYTKAYDLLKLIGDDRNAHWVYEFHLKQ